MAKFNIDNKRKEMKELNAVYPIESMDKDSALFVLTVMDAFDVDNFEELKEKLENMTEEDLERIFNIVAESVETELSDEDKEVILENILALENTLNIASEEELVALADTINKYIDEENSVDANDVQNSDESTDDKESAVDTVMNADDVDNNVENKRKCKKKKKKMMNGEVVEETVEDVDCPEGVEEGTIIEEVEEVEEDIKNEAKIVDPKEYYSETPQGKVNKAELRKRVLMEYEEGKLTEEDVREIFGIVECLDKQECLKFPIREYVEGKGYVVNINGLRTAALFLIKENTSKNLTPEQKKALAQQLIKYYEALEITPPEALKKIAAGETNASISIDISDEEIREYAEEMGTTYEEVVTALSVIETLLTQLKNKGFLDIPSNAADSDILIQLSRKEIPTLIEIVDKLTDGIVAAISGEEVQTVDGMYLAELEELRTQLNELTRKLEEAAQEKNELTAKIETLEATLEEKDKIIAQNELLKEKFELLLNAIKNDSNYEQIVSTILEAETKEELKAYKKVLNAVKLKNPKLKKKSLLSEDVSTVINLIENDDDENINKGKAKDLVLDLL